MNTAKVYSGVIALEKPGVEPTDESSQIIIDDDLAKWLKNPHTKKLLEFLQQRRQELFNCALVKVEDKRAVKLNLHKVAMINEVLSYVTTSR